MQSQSWMATVLFAIIAFAGGYLAGSRGPGAGWARTPGTQPASEFHCFFSPHGGCTQSVVSEIATARHSIDVHGCVLTSVPITTALSDAYRRGVKVRVLLDAALTSEHREQARILARAGVPVSLDARHATAHNKVILIDERTLLVGSFDFTQIAEDGNADNLLVIRDQPQLQSAYEDNFREHLSHSERYDGQ